VKQAHQCNSIPPVTRHAHTRPLTPFISATCCSAIGVSAWGLASSLQETDDTVSDFWGIVRDAQSRVRRMYGRTGRGGRSVWRIGGGAVQRGMGGGVGWPVTVWDARHPRGATSAATNSLPHACRTLQVHYTALALEDMRGQAVALQQASTVLSDNQQGEPKCSSQRWQINCAAVGCNASAARRPAG